MFEGDEYRAYVDLCRELKLERHGREGDWRLAFDPVDPAEREFCFRVVGSDGLYAFDAPHYDSSYEVIWLPTLAQWLDMLREASPIIRMPTDSECNDAEYRWDITISQAWRGHWMAELEWSDGTQAYCQMTERTRTPEEAAARLWMAVTQR